MYNRASGTDVYGAAITLYLDAVEAHSCVDPLMPNSFFEQNTTVKMINQLQDVSTRRSLSTAYTIRSEVRGGYLYTKR